MKGLNDLNFKIQAVESRLPEKSYSTCSCGKTRSGELEPAGGSLCRAARLHKWPGSREWAPVPVTADCAGQERQTGKE